MEQRYDVVVVGGGVGGLVAGGLLAKAGRSVLVLEAEDSPGGFARSFVSNGYSFDLADHFAMSCWPDGPFGDGFTHQILSALGVADEVSFVAADPFYAVRHMGETYVLPGPRDAHLGALVSYFPKEERGIRALFQLYDQVYRDMIGMPVEVHLREKIAIPWRFPVTFRKRHRSVAALLSEYTRDSVLQAVHTALSPYIGLPPSRASALAWAGMMASYTREGAFYPMGGYQSFSDALAEGVRRQGGRVRLGERVASIRTDGQRVWGVRTERGEEIAAPLVIAAMDPREVFGRMLGGDGVPSRYRLRLDRGETALSVVALYLGVDCDLAAQGLVHETVVMTGDSEQVYRAGDVREVIMTTPTLTDPGRSPSGHHTVVLKAVAPGDDDRATHHAAARAMIHLAERVVPDLRDAVVHVDGRTEDDPWPLRRLGPIYGWAMTPDQMGIYRLGHETPIAGLYLAGHWTAPAAGLWGASASAVQLVRTILHEQPRAGLSPLRV